MMQKLVLILMVFVFSAGFVTSAAYAFGCPNQGKMEQSMGGDMPCHGQNDQQKQDQDEPCGALCLCLHLTINQNMTLQDGAVLSVPRIAKLSVFTDDDAVRAPPSAPLFRPPKLFS